MIHPDPETFRKKCAEGNLIPVWREILADMDTPVSAFKKIADSENAFLLESVEQGENLGRYSFLGCDPDVVFKCKDQEINILYRGIEEDFNAATDPLKSLQEFMERYKPVHDEELPSSLPLSGGAVGYFSYDMVRHWESLPDNNPDDLALPDAIFCIADTLIAFDHVKHKMILISNAHTHEDPEAAYQEAIHKIDMLHERLSGPIHAANNRNHPKATRACNDTETGPEETDRDNFQSNLSQEQFEEAVLKCKDYIRAGDIFQVVISQRFQQNFEGDPFDLYRALRTINPSPYMYYLQLGDLRIAGSSPEILINLEGDEVCVRPIAGTRPRGKTQAEDLELEESLLADPKERAEHVMLLDLGRNDIGRVAQYGSIKVEDFMMIERYSHVMHMVSNVKGRLREGMNVFDVLRAGFPAGTVSGAPKIRAMEIIDEMENLRRGPYAGAVGYISFSGNMSTAITIRTMVIKGETAYIQAGAGIVADSVPATEYEETRNKARGMFRALDMAENGLG